MKKLLFCILAVLMICSVFDSAEAWRRRKKKKVDIYPSGSTYKLSKSADVVAVRFMCPDEPDAILSILDGSKIYKFKLPAIIYYPEEEKSKISLELSSGEKLYGDISIIQVTEFTKYSAPRVIIKKEMIDKALSGEVQIIIINDPTLENNKNLDKKGKGPQILNLKIGDIDYEAEFANDIEIIKNDKGINPPNSIFYYSRDRNRVGVKFTCSGDPGATLTIPKYKKGYDFELPSIIFYGVKDDEEQNLQINLSSGRKLFCKLTVFQNTPYVFNSAVRVDLEKTIIEQVLQGDVQIITVNDPTIEKLRKANKLKPGKYKYDAKILTLKIGDIDID